MLDFGRKSLSSKITPTHTFYRSADNLEKAPSKNQLNSKSISTLLIILLIVDACDSLEICFYKIATI